MDDGSNTWATATHMADQARDAGSCHRPGPVLVVAAHYLTLCHSVF